jgi:hypothetical protein
MVADQIMCGKLEPLSAAKLVTATADKAMEIVEERSTEAVPVEGGEDQSRNERQPDAQGSRSTSMSSQVKANGEAMPRTRSARLSSLPNARRSRRCTGG